MFVKYYIKWYFKNLLGYYKKLINKKSGKVMSFKWYLIQLFQPNLEYLCLLLVQVHDKNILCKKNSYDIFATTLIYP